jgi:hypothetical protein
MQSTKEVVVFFLKYLCSYLIPGSLFSEATGLISSFSEISLKVLYSSLIFQERMVFNNW